LVATTVDVKVRARWDGRDVNRGVETVDRNLQGVRGTLSRMAPLLRTIGGLMGVAVGAQMARQAIQVADAWKGYENRIKLFTSSAKETAEVQERLFKISQRTRSAVGGTVELYQRFSIANKELKLSQEELGRVLETVNQALIISGGSAESANAAIVQLGQGLASGVLRGEELNSVLEQAPRLAQAIAAGMGVPIGKLRALGAEGKITALQVIEALQSQGKTVQEEFGKMEVTVSSGWTVLNNAIGLYISNLNESIGLTKTLGEAMVSVASTINAPDREGPRSEQDADIAALSRARRLESSPGVMSFNAPSPLDPGSSLIKALTDPAEGRRVLSGGQDSMRALGGAIAEAVRGPSGFGSAGFPEISGAKRFNIKSPDTSAAFFHRSNSGLRGGALDTGGGAPRSLADQRLLTGLAAGGQGMSDDNRQLMQREAEALATSERNLLRVRQEFEFSQADRAGSSETELGFLKQVHSAELIRFDTRAALHEQAKANAIADKLLRADNAKARAEEARSQRDLNRAINIGVAGMKQLVPEFSTFFDAAALAISGNPLSALAAGITGVIGLLGESGDQHAKYQDSIAETNRALREQIEALNQVGLSLGGEFAVEVRRVQLDAVQPLLDLFREFRGDNFGKAEGFVTDLNSFIEQIGTQARGLNDGKTRAGPGRQAQFIAGLNLDEIRAGIETAFGRGTPIEDAIRRMFSIRDSFEDVSDAAAKAVENLNPLQRAVSQTFDAREMGLRRQAQSAFAGAGGDVHAQAQVFSGLKDSIDALQRAETAALKQATHAKNRGGSGPTPAGKALADLDAAGPGGGRQSLGVGSIPGPETFSNIVDLSATTPIEIPWSHAVDMVVNEQLRHKPTHWGNMVDIPSTLKAYERPWYRAVQMNVETEYRHRPSHWGNLVDIPADLKRYERDWARTVEFTTNNRQTLGHWADVLDVSAAGRITVDLNDIIRVTGNPRRISISDIVDLSGLEGIIEGVVARSGGNRTSGESHDNRLRLDDLAESVSKVQSAMRRRPPVTPTYTVDKSGTVNDLEATN